MTGRADERAAEERLDLIDALVYGDAFDCAVSLDELRRFARVPATRVELEDLLHGDPVLRQVVVMRDGFFCRADRAYLAERRRARLRQAARLQRRARRVARVLCHMPFVRGLVLTGSVAAGDAGPDDDVDLLVVVAPGRLATVFLLLGSTSRLLGRRVFCPNYYVREDRLEFERRTLYVARELVQAVELVGEPGRLAEANRWIGSVFPNAESERSSLLPPAGRSRAQRRFEAILERPLGERIERKARRVVAARLRAHYGRLGQEVPADVTREVESGVALRFHGHERSEDALGRYTRRRRELAARMAAAEAVAQSARRGAP